MQNKKECSCFLCGRYGIHYWHHIFGGSRKKFSEKYNAIVYPCWPCHRTNTDSIHNDEAKNRRLKQEHQKRIMEEQEWTMQDWLRIVGENYLD